MRDASGTKSCIEGSEAEYTSEDMRSVEIEWDEVEETLFCAEDTFGIFHCNAPRRNTDHVRALCKIN